MLSPLLFNCSFHIYLNFEVHKSFISDNCSYQFFFSFSFVLTTTLIFSLSASGSLLKSSSSSSTNLYLHFCLFYIMLPGLFSGYLMQLAFDHCSPYGYFVTAKTQFLHCFGVNYIASQTSSLSIIVNLHTLFFQNLIAY